MNKVALIKKSCRDKIKLGSCKVVGVCVALLVQTVWAFALWNHCRLIASNASGTIGSL